MRKKFEPEAVLAVLALLAFAGVSFLEGIGGLKEPASWRPREPVYLNRILGRERPVVREIVYQGRDMFQFGDGKNSGHKDRSSDQAPDNDRLELQGFVENGGGYSVLINDRLLDKGGRVNGWKVESVSKSSVALTKNGEKRILRLGGNK